MKTYTAEELQDILEKHKNWLEDKKGEKEKANLQYADLSSVNLSGADLQYADLFGVNLSGANLHDADLHDADLWGANLRYADLRGADLCGADLCDANLCNADLCNANLSDANLRDAIGNFKQIKSMQLERYWIAYTLKVIQIGCQKHTIEEWKNFTDDEIDKMHLEALKWWKKWKPILMQIIEMSPAEK